METALTYENVLNLIREQSIEFRQQSIEFQKNLDRERIEREKRKLEFEEELEKSRREFDKELKKSRIEFDKKLGQIAGTWRKFVAEMVRPKIVELFNGKGIQIETTVQAVQGFKDGQRYYEIDLLLINTNVAVVVEIKSSLSVEDVNEHLERIEKIRKISPKRIDLSGVTIYGAVAGMIVEGEADKYAYKKGLFVLRQNGNIVEIVNDARFQPREWKVEY